MHVGSQAMQGFQNLELQHSCVRWLSSFLDIISFKDSYMVKICALFIIMRRVLTMSKNVNEDWYLKCTISFDIHMGLMTV